MTKNYPDFSDTSVANWNWYTGESFLAYWLNTILDLTEPDNQRTSETIAGNFQSCNKVAEVIDRHVAALNPSSLAIDNLTLQKLLEKWQRENSGTFGHPLKEAVIRAKLDSRAYIRLFFRKTYTAETLFGSLEIHCPPIDSVVAYRDSDNILTGFDYYYREDNRLLIERQFLRNGKTVFQTLVRSPLAAGFLVEKEFEKDLGGGFTIFEINVKKLLTESIKKNQNGINFALTLLPHNLVYSGWIQETVLNAQPPGTWEYDQNHRERFIPTDPTDRPNSGAGITRFFQGLPVRDALDNHVGYTSPAMHIQQPIDADVFVETFRTLSQSIYEQSGQSFVLSNDLILSGISREQSRLDFQDAVTADAEILSYVYSDVLTVCSFFLGIGERINAKLVPKIDMGIEQKNLVLKAQAQGLVSKRTAVKLLGFAADVDAELAELTKEADETSARLQPSININKKPAPETLG